MIRRPMLRALVSASRAASFATLSAVAIACHGARSSSSAAARNVTEGPAPDTASLMRDVRYLAGDALEGRGTGTAGNDSAAAYIARRFAGLGLASAFTNGDGRLCGAVTGATSRCDGRFVQPFVARSVAAVHAGLQGELPTHNVAAIVRGTDPASS